jgi:hypothetical protein
MGGHLNWKGEWVSEESPFERAGEYSLQQELIKEVIAVTAKYQGRISDEIIAEALQSIIKRYHTI